MLVERLAAEAGTPLLCLSPSAILSKWAGESEKSVSWFGSIQFLLACRRRRQAQAWGSCPDTALQPGQPPPCGMPHASAACPHPPQVRAVFEAAAAMSPAMIFIDEVDSLAPCRRVAVGGGSPAVGARLRLARSGRRLHTPLRRQRQRQPTQPPHFPGLHSPACRGGTEDLAARRVLTELLVQMSAAANRQGALVWVLAATNRLGDCDPALLRRWGGWWGVLGMGAPWGVAAGQENMPGAVSA